MTKFIRYWFYPLLLVLTLVAALWTLRGGSDLQRAFGYFTLARLALCFLVEWVFPYRREWAMTWRSFLRDLKYTAVVGGLSFAAKFSAGWFAIGIADNFNGWLSAWPLLAQILALILCYEFFQYWQHRYSHEGRSSLGQFLWRVHATHHLPKRVYLMMHAVGHPINFAIVVAINVGVIYGLGASKDAVFLFNVLMGLQGLVSHFNVQLSAGPLNYVLVGTELHRYHHSSELSEAGNYGVVTPFWDLVFGTFRYEPKRAPVALGVIHPEYYPGSQQIVQTLLLPFRPAKTYASSANEP